MSYCRRRAAPASPQDSKLSNIKIFANNPEKHLQAPVFHDRSCQSTATAGKGRANIPALNPQILGQLLTLHILPNHAWSRSTPRGLTRSPTTHESTLPRLMSVRGTVTTRGVEGSERGWGLSAAGAPVSQPPHTHFQTEVLQGCKLFIPRDRHAVNGIRCASLNRSCSADGCCLKGGWDQSAKPS